MDVCGVEVYCLPQVRTYNAYLYDKRPVQYGYKIFYLSINKK